MKTKGVSFNMTDPDQMELLQFAMQRSNFSGYIKRLIQRDKEQKERAQQQQQRPTGIKLELR